MPLLRVGLIVGKRHIFDVHLPPGLEMPFHLRQPLDGKVGLGADFPLFLHEEEMWFLYFHLRLNVQVALHSQSDPPELLRDAPSIASRGQAVDERWFKLGLKTGDRGKIEIPGSIPWHILFHLLDAPAEASFVLTTWDFVTDDA